VIPRETTKLGPPVSWNIRGCQIAANITSSGLRIQPRTSTQSRGPPQRHKHGDPTTKLEGRPGQLHHSKLAMRTFDVYANILKCMYSTRFNGGATRSEASPDAQPTPCIVTSLTHPISTLPQSDKYKRQKKESPKERDK
jgi:hypothetical protein